MGDVDDYVKDEMRRARVEEASPVLSPSDWRTRFDRFKKTAGFRTARSRARLLRWRRRMYATKLGRVGVKLVVALLGTLVVAVGVLLLPLPGPGWVIILAGLAILALEFHWARQLLIFTRRQLRRWTRLVRDGSWLVKIASIGGLLVVIAMAMWLSYVIVA